MTFMLHLKNAFLRHKHFKVKDFEKSINNLINK